MQAIQDLASDIEESIGQGLGDASMGMQQTISSADMRAINARVGQFHAWTGRLDTMLAVEGSSAAPGTSRGTNPAESQRAGYQYPDVTRIVQQSDDRLFTAFGTNRVMRFGQITGLHGQAVVIGDSPGNRGAKATRLQPLSPATASQSNSQQVT